MKKIIIWLTILSVLNLIGCSTGETINKNNNTGNNSLFVQRDVGAEVFILMNDGGEFTGELLRVRDSTIILSKEYGASEEDLSQLVHPFYLFQNYDIKMIELKGNNNIIVGIIFGGLIGGLVGGGIGLAIENNKPTEPDDNSFKILDFSKLDAFAIGCCIGGSMGVIMGALIGGDDATYDEEV